MCFLVWRFTIMVFCAEGKKSKLAKSPCVSGGDSLTKERPEPGGRQPVGGEKGEGERREGGGEMGEVEDGGWGKKERGKREDGEEGGLGASQNGAMNLKAVDSGAGTDYTMAAKCDRLLTNDSTTELVNGDATDEGDVLLIHSVNDAALGSPCSSQSKLEPDTERISSPSAGVSGEEGLVVTSVMSEEDEGPLDSSMEELHSIPTGIEAPIVTTVETDGESDTPPHDRGDHVIGFLCSCRGGNQGQRQRNC